MNMLMIARALVRNQHGPEVFVGAAAVGLSLAAIGVQTIPTLDHGYPLHLFTLGPGAISAVSSVAASPKLEEPRLSVDHRLAIFRGLWCVLVAAACALLLWPAAESMDRADEMGPSTVLLVGLTFAAYTVVGSAAWCVGAANTLAAISLPRLFGDTDPVTSWIRGWGPDSWPMAAMSLGLCALIYGALGAPRLRE